jgi:hypothetical protein
MADSRPNVEVAEHDPLGPVKKFLGETKRQFSESKDEHRIGWLDENLTSIEVLYSWENMVTRLEVLIVEPSAHDHQFYYCRVVAAANNIVTGLLYPMFLSLEEAEEGLVIRLTETRFGEPAEAFEPESFGDAAAGRAFLLNTAANLFHNILNGVDNVDRLTLATLESLIDQPLQDSLKLLSLDKAPRN